MGDDGASVYEDEVLWVVLKVKSVNENRCENGFEREDNRLLSAALQVSYSNNGCLYVGIRGVDTSNPRRYGP